jgi:parvulin-like peptidyl-prolyl isomerase
MYRVRPLHIVGIIAFVTATVAGAAAQGAPPAQATPPAQAKSGIIEKIIVKVNGEILTQSELERDQIETLQRQQNSKVVDAKQLSTDADSRRPFRRSRLSCWRTRSTSLLIVQFGRELGVKFTEDRFKQALDNVKKENKLDDKQFAQALKEANLTLDQLRQNFERTVHQADRRAPGNHEEPDADGGRSAAVLQSAS